MKKVKYIRDHVFTVEHTPEGPQVKMRRFPVACVVQNEHGFCGVSVCNDTDYEVMDATFDNDSIVIDFADVPGDSFTKKFGRELATMRANTGVELQIPNKRITNVFGKTVRLSDEINFWVDRFKSQANNLESV